MLTKPRLRHGGEFRHPGEHAPSASSGAARRVAGPREQVSVAGAVLKFALAGLVAVAIISVAVLFVGRRAAMSEAINDARQLTSSIAIGVVEPALTDGLVEGDPAAIAQFDAVIRQRVLGNPAIRVKLWTADGRIVYSDEPRLMGDVYLLDDDKRQAFIGGKASASLSHLSGLENRFEPPNTRLLEVYRPVHTPGGTALLFEAYQPFDSIAASSWTIWLRFLPALLAGLVALELVHIPLAWSLARRLQRRQAERERLLNHALGASDAERQRIAAELHDGAVQGLAGQALTLAAMAKTAADPAIAAALGESARAARRTLQEMRGTLLDLHPPTLHATGLTPAIRDLAMPLLSHDVEVAIATRVEDELDPALESLLFRTCREALRNIEHHSGATRVEISLTAGGREATLVISDNGCGFTPETRAQRRVEGHVGLDLLTSLAEEAGGRMSISSTAGTRAGTTLLLQVALP